jgi:hypothetical protein
VILVNNYEGVSPGFNTIMRLAPPLPQREEPILLKVLPVLLEQTKLKLILEN